MKTTCKKSRDTVMFSQAVVDCPGRFTVGYQVGICVCRYPASMFLVGGGILEGGGSPPRIFFPCKRMGATVSLRQSSFTNNW
jgi:hypothetical protein